MITKKIPVHFLAPSCPFCSYLQTDYDDLFNHDTDTVSMTCERCDETFMCSKHVKSSYSSNASQSE